MRSIQEAGERAGTRRPDWQAPPSGRRRIARLDDAETWTASNHPPRGNLAAAAGVCIPERPRREAVERRRGDGVGALYTPLTPDGVHPRSRARLDNKPAWVATAPPSYSSASRFGKPSRIGSRPWRGEVPGYRARAMPNSERMLWRSGGPCGVGCRRHQPRAPVTSWDRYPIGDSGLAGDRLACLEIQKDASRGATFSRKFAV